MRKSRHALFNDRSMATHFRFSAGPVNLHWRQVKRSIGFSVGFNGLHISHHFHFYFRFFSPQFCELELGYVRRPQV